MAAARPCAAAGAKSGWDVFDSSSDEDEPAPAPPAPAPAASACAAADAGAAAGAGAGTGAEAAAGSAVSAATSVLALLEREGHHHLAQDLLLSPSAALSLQDLLAVRRVSTAQAPDWGRSPWPHSAVSVPIRRIELP